MHQDDRVTAGRAVLICPNSVELGRHLIDDEQDFAFGPSMIADAERLAELGQVGLSDCVASVVRFRLAHSEFTDISQVRR